MTYGSDSHRWSRRLHTPEHLAQDAASRTSDAMATILAELRIFDADDLVLDVVASPVVAPGLSSQAG